LFVNDIARERQITEIEPFKAMWGA